MTPTQRKAMQDAIDYIRSTSDYKMGSPAACETVCDLNEALAEPAPVPLLTDDEYTALAHRIASKYAHRSDPKHIAYTFLPHTLEQFVRAIEALYRQKAGL